MSSLLKRATTSFARPCLARYHFHVQNSFTRSRLAACTACVGRCSGTAHRSLKNGRVPTCRVNFFGWLRAAFSARFAACACSLFLSKLYRQGLSTSLSGGTRPMRLGELVQPVRYMIVHALNGRQPLPRWKTLGAASLAVARLSTRAPAATPNQLLRRLAT